ncbi:hypothetical protein BBAD15_g11280 [Beauveria bassiana D1-5]|uniref:Secreted protein n=1 Tax=Beauveria bassiana D1-5 TaxID=1245745 RepID=A0A0A2V7K7_BEABA|nr:hypothetical protein BBAD15_g11280 [Beauveria bassiana D1-5]
MLLLLLLLLLLRGLPANPLAAGYSFSNRCGAACPPPPIASSQGICANGAGRSEKRSAALSRGSPAAATVAVAPQQAFGKLPVPREPSERVH